MFLQDEDHVERVLGFLYDRQFMDVDLFLGHGLTSLYFKGSGFRVSGKRLYLKGVYIKFSHLLNWRQW